MTKLDKLIEEKGLKKSYIAHKIGISPGLLSKYISGERKPKLDTAKKLSEILECSIEDIFFAKNTISVVNNRN